MEYSEFFDQGLSTWMQQDGPDSDVVISSRIRLARNIANISFSPLMTEQVTEELLARVQSVVGSQSFRELGDYQMIRIKDLDPLERRILVEKHLISPRLSDDFQHSAVILKDDESANVMLNEEDHLRIQCIYPGLQLQKGFQLANQIDDAIEQTVEYAFDEKLGYLTSCLTNVGTGLRASAMLHIPALVITGQVKRLISAIQRVGLAVRGYYGEGSEAAGNIFQISNQLTLGLNEEEILENLEDVIKQIIEHERDARKNLLHHSKAQLEDKIFRSLGILAYARVISTQEAMERISDIRLGIDLGMIDGVSCNILKELMVLMGTGFMQRHAGRELTAEERDSKRASLIRERLCNYNIEKS